MELRHLRYFVGVAQELNFTRAARKLRVAQPALSRQVRQLEAEVGVTLLERNRRGVQLTDAGRAFLAEAESLLEQSEQAIRVAQATRPGAKGRLNLGYVWGLFHSQVPAVVERFRRQYPDVAVNLFDLTATQQAEGLSQGRLDAAFIGFALEADAARLAKRKIGSCSLVAALPRSHRSARASRVSLAALAQDFFFAISEQSYPGASRIVLEACEQAGFRPRILQAAERGHTILGLVAGNCGVALLPEPLKALPHPGVVFRPLVQSTQSDLFIAWQPARQSAMRDAFLGSLESRVRSRRRFNTGGPRPASSAAASSPNIS